MRVIQHKLLYNKIEIEELKAYIKNKLKMNEEEISEIHIDNVIYNQGTVYMDGSYDETSIIDFSIILKNGQVIEDCIHVFIPAYLHDD